MTSSLPLSPAAELSDIRMNYGSGDVLRGLSLKLTPGRVIALLGINGAGKSTLMQILAGVVKPTAGSIALSGNVAMVFQELSLIADLSIAENLALPRLKRFRRLGRLDWAAMEQAARQTLARVGLDLDVRRHAGNLTTGEAQLVEIARALDQNPGILILDEPTSALSRKETERLFAILKKLVTDSNCTVLFVSHRLDEVKEIADEVVILKDGVVAGILSEKQIDPRQIVTLMTGLCPQEAAAATPGIPAKNRAALLSVSDLVVTHESCPLLEYKGSFTLHAGQCLGLAGLMGSGRSVFLRAIASRLRLASGGYAIPKGDLKIEGKIKGVNIAYVHEDRKTAGLFADLTSLENIAAAERGRTRFGRAERLFHKLSVRGLPETPAAQLSGGNQQKLLFGRALLSQARVLLLDEPTRGVDASARRDIYQMMRDFTAAGGAILWISSDFDELVEQSHEVLGISRGRVLPDFLRASSGTELTQMILEQEAIC